MTKDIQLCALGNGLVDLQFYINDDELESLNAKKSEMRLISDEEFKLLIEYSKTHKFHQMSGGSAANSIIAFSKMGGKGGFITVLGNDDFGKFYANEFKELGITLETEFLDTYPTGICFIFISPDSERTMLTYLGATSHIAPKHINEDLIARSEWLYAEGYMFSQKDSTDALFKAFELCKKNNTKIALTFSDVFITENFSDKINEILPLCDLIFCNENEAKTFTKEDLPDKAIDKLFSMTHNAIITQGSKGSIIKWGQDIYEIPSYPASPIDATGAGDMFAGVFLYGIISLANPMLAGHLASLSAAKVVSQMGARMAADYDEIKSQIIGGTK
ncbi:MAG: adenosine kinase [Chloroherpetonaceae bacterium]|nr:adenosine kinase [bacterium]